MKKVKKALIPAAGLGTRFLPVTKTVPKEMLPIVDRPILLYIVEEAARAGIEDVVIVAGRGKTAIEDFFDRSVELESALEKAGKMEWLEDLVKIRSSVNVISIRQKEALGLGHAVLCGRPVIGEEPFAVLLGDEIMLTPKSSPTAIEQLMTLHYDSQISTVAIMKIDGPEIEKYGVVELEKATGSYFKIKKVIEKPKLSEAPSSYALPGRYVFDSQIFTALAKTRPGKNGEIQLTDAMTDVAKNQGMIGVEVQGKRYDAGDRLGYLIANIEFALARPDLAPELKTYLINLAKGL